MYEKISIAPIYQVCVDHHDKKNISGQLYCGCFTDGKAFYGIEDLLLELDDVMDSIAFPHSTMEKRVFGYKKKPKACRNKKREELVAMRNFDTKKQKGKIATFLLEIQFRQNASWQGTMKWVEKGQVMAFESALEMMEIIQEAIAQGHDVNLEEA